MGAWLARLGILLAELAAAISLGWLIVIVAVIAAIIVLIAVFG